MRFACRSMSLSLGLSMAVGLAALFIAPMAAGVEQTLPGPVPARVVTVIDGDTILVRARIWLGQEVETRVRLQGVDAPELNGKCAAERRLAVRARDFAIRKMGDGRVLLMNVKYGKYAGRVVARIRTPDGADLSAALLEAGLGRPYSGGRRGSWCPG